MISTPRKPRIYLKNANLVEQVMISKERFRMNNDPTMNACEFMTPELIDMIMMLVDRYASRSNWKNYCVDETTECLTKRGWLTLDEINENDTILSYNGERLCWSITKSIFRSEYAGMMFHMTTQGLDALVTPRHRFVTENGLTQVEHLKERDRLVLLGESVAEPNETQKDSFIELVGWFVTEGNYYYENCRRYPRVSISQKEGGTAARIRKCLRDLGYGYGEGGRDSGIRTFYLRKETCLRLLDAAPDKVLSMNFVLSLTQRQRELLIRTMIAGDGWTTHDQHMNYTQVSKAHTDSFVTLCALAGLRTSTKIRAPVGYGKRPCHVVRVFSKSRRHSIVANINFHGAKTARVGIGVSKETYPNTPTVPYSGRIWCPKTEFGSFVARRNGCVYLTGNTYLDDMKSEAVLALLVGSLKYNPEKSPNAFGYLTQIVHNSFLTTLDKEKRVRDIRDDLIEQEEDEKGRPLQPSITRQLANESGFMRKMEERFYRVELGQEPPVLFEPRKRRRKKKVVAKKNE